MPESCLWKSQVEPPERAFVGYEGSDGPELLLGRPETMHVGQQCAAWGPDRISKSLFPSGEVIYGNSHEERTH